MNGTILEDAPTCLPPVSLAPDNAPEGIDLDSIDPDGTDAQHMEALHPRVQEDLHPRVQKALDYIRDKKTATRSELDAYLAKSVKTTGNTLNQLIELGLIKRHGKLRAKNTFYSVV